jgi:unsaturated chondroitin disaccharide hydrolase
MRSSRSHPPRRGPWRTREALLAGLALVATGGLPTLAAPAVDPLLAESLQVAKERYQAIARQRLGNNRERFPEYTNAAGVWQVRTDATWTSGFLPGSFWYLYDLSGQSRWRSFALHWDAGVRSRATATDNDTGFQILDSFGTALDLDPAADVSDYTAVILEAAATMTAQRWNPTIGAYRAWPQGTNNPTAMPFELNIDMLMNMELVLWAAGNGGPAAYVDHAIAHADTSWRDLVRPDFSTYHVAEYNASGEVVNKRTHQGWTRDSTWSRGQAWAVYGYTMLYRHTGLPRMLERAEATYAYFVAATDAQSVDGIPFSDFDAPLDHRNPRDSSAAAIVASAALELYQMTGKQSYLERAEHILRSLGQPPYLTTGTSHEALLAKASATWDNHEVGAIFADFYFLESIWRYWEWIPASGGVWHGYPARSGHLVRTGNWLREINVRHAPWLYLYERSTWAYLYESGTPSDHGEWLYFLRP